MTLVRVVLGVGLLALVFWDAFETLILPRRVSSRLRLARSFFRMTWWVWATIAPKSRKATWRENMLSYYGPLSLFLLLAIWAAVLVAGFALLLPLGHYVPRRPHGVSSLLYISASTFSTLGLGGLTPANSLTRFLTVAEGLSGLLFLALVVSYLPVLYQSFSRREVRISMLDERAGSPPSAGELLRRRGRLYNVTGAQFLRDWELWAAELLESHLSYTVLGYFRSQHDNQSWLSALTLILDTCALVLAGVEGINDDGQAKLTFAMARHAAVDLAAVFGTRPHPPPQDRLPPEDLEVLRSMLVDYDVVLRRGDEVDTELASIRASYEPYVHALADHLLMPLPRWLPEEEVHDNWRATRWDGPGTKRRTRGHKH